MSGKRLWLKGSRFHRTSLLLHCCVVTAALLLRYCCVTATSSLWLKESRFHRTSLLRHCHVTATSLPRHYHVIALAQGSRFHHTSPSRNQARCARLQEEEHRRRERALATREWPVALA